MMEKGNSGLTAHDPNGASDTDFKHLITPPK